MGMNGWNVGLTQDQINAGFSRAPDGTLSYNPGFPIASVAGAGIGLLVHGASGAIVGGLIGFLVGHALNAQQAAAVRPAG